MSILIKGMEMPKNCDTCELSSTDSSGFFGCCVTGSIIMRKREQERPNWCPLVELPPHGRLIDADVLYDSMMMAMVMTGYQSRALSEIDYAPTIIESEEEK